MGKTSLLKTVPEGIPHLRVAISHTTRLRRDGDRDGVDYHFVSKAEFIRMKSKSAFLETAKVFGDDYATSRSAVRNLFDNGYDVVLEIDRQGAAQIRALMPNQSVFILPPSKTTLCTRLKQRGKDSAEVIEERYAQAFDEMRHYHEFDFVVVNDCFDRTCRIMRQIFSGKRPDANVQAQVKQAIVNLGL